MPWLLPPRKCCRFILLVLLLCLAAWMLLTGLDKLPFGPPRIQVSRWDYTDADLSPNDTCDCSSVLRGDPEAVEQATLLNLQTSFRKRTHLSDNYFLNVSQDCSTFLSTRKYLTFPLSREEEEFPVAFSLVVHHKVQTFERLLRSIYAPQNWYCVHVDTKAPTSVLAAITSITSCFHNVFLCSQPVRVVYASWSRVQADINCMSDLYNISSTWKYFINLCGQDLPIKTNLEMVRRLKELNGHNSLESENVPGNAGRWMKVHRVINGKLQRTEEDKSPPPFNLPIKVGGAYIVVTRAFVEHVLNDSRILELMKWAEDTYSPDEFLWATIQRMSGVPGSQRPNSKYDTSDMQAISRIVKWQWYEGPEEDWEVLYPPCQGQHVRGVCVYGAGDLWWILQQHHLFANKFDMDQDPMAVHCLEKYLRNKALMSSRLGGSQQSRLT